MKAFFIRLQGWWFALSSLALSVLYFLYELRGKRIQDLSFEVEKTKIDAKLNEAKKAADADKTEAKEKEKTYEELKAQHPDLVSRLKLRSINGGKK